jgi:hypothetical protein
MDDQITIGHGVETMDFYVHSSKQLEVTVNDEILFIDMEQAKKLARFMEGQYPEREPISEQT